MSEFKDLKGKRFGKWLVIDQAPTDQKSRTRWNCLCDCGTAKVLPTGNLTWRLSRSCASCGRFASRKPEAAFNQVVSLYKCNARNRNRIWDLSDEEFKALSQKACHYCGRGPYKTKTLIYSKFTYNGIDRKDNSVGYTLENSLPCCHECNWRKGAVGYTEFISWIKLLTNISEPEYGMSAC